MKNKKLSPEVLEARRKIRDIKSAPIIHDCVTTNMKPWQQCRQQCLHHLCDQYGLSLRQFLAVASIVAGRTVLESHYLKRTDVSSEKQFLTVLWEFKKLLKKRDALTVRKISSNSYLRSHKDFRKWLDNSDFHINGSRY